MKFTTEFVNFEGHDKYTKLSNTIESLLREKIGEVMIDRIVVCGGLGMSEVKKLAGIDVSFLDSNNPTSNDLSLYLGQRILLISISDFAASILSASTESHILAIEELDLSGDHIFTVHTSNAETTSTEKKPVFIETYADFPILFKVYLLHMETIKSLLVLIKDAEKTGQDSVRAVLVNHLSEKLELYKERSLIANGLPHMNLEDIKMNLAGLFLTAHENEHKHEHIAPMDILQQINTLSRMINSKHEFSLSLESLPPDLQKDIDKNNLALATIETELRFALVKQLKAAIGDKVDAINLLGSASYGAYYEVKESSDVDTEVLFSDDSFLEFTNQFEVGSIDQLSDVEVDEILKTKQGNVFETLRILTDKGYIKNSKDALKQFGVFAKLRQLNINDSLIVDKTGYETITKVGSNFADYLSYKVEIDGVDVSIHVVSSEVYLLASSLDLENISRTHSLNEVRVGKRKKIIAGQKESSEQNYTNYPDKSSFDGTKIDYKSPVSALVNINGDYVLYKPSELEEHEVKEADVLAWVTAVPAVVVRNQKMYHGLFQDKVIWGQFDSKTSTDLFRAKQTLLVNVIRRFVHEVEREIINENNSSILQLSSRFERIPSFTKRKMLLWLKTEEPEVFNQYSEALKKIHSNELETFGIKM